ncbi:MAG TPA: 16S rRNA (cytidine(1402)-2'-O)-methyltransferase [Gemmatimonadales bacterium]|nr:16S rRNA (cytidine(1402)-2'-O)-methyltransferase [Gemmatimonadales bacterium]
MSAALYVVATPLGNLEDLSARAAAVLSRVSVVAAEDTRRTSRLLAHLGATPRLLSFHAHSPERRIDTLLDVLQQGRDVALVSDAGTPLISDPGAGLVCAVRAAGFAVVPIPGPSAVTTALSAAGLGGDRYLFLGFLPRKGGERRRLLERAAHEPWPVVMFEAPARLVALLDDLVAVAGPDRPASVARELTKIHEEIRTDRLEALRLAFAAVEPRGEITVILGAAPPEPEELANPDDAMALARRLLAEGKSRKDAAAGVADQMGWPRNEAYRLVNDLDVSLE